MAPLDVLRRLPLFALFGKDWLTEWLAQGEVVTMALGETLCQAGVWGRWLMLVEEGRVRVLRQAGSGREVSLASLGPGEVFGEYALLSPGALPATCRAAVAGRVLRLPLRRLRLALANRPEVRAEVRGWLRLHAVVRFLREEGFLGFMAAPSFLPLLDRFRTVRFAAGHTVQANGLADDCWFLVREGAVRVDDAAGPPLDVRPGGCLGEPALVGAGQLPTAVAVVATECLSLHRDEFLTPYDGGPHSRQTHASGLKVPPARPVWVGQREASDCGVAALTMIAQTHGRNVSLGEVRQRLRVDERGCSLLELQQGAEALGFRGQAVRIGLEQLAAASLPAVALQANGHYVVVFSACDESVVVGDPAQGLVTLDARAFRQQWTGLLLLLRPREDADQLWSGAWMPPALGGPGS